MTACWIFAYNCLHLVFLIKVKYVFAWEQIKHLSHKQEIQLHPLPAVKPSANSLIWVPQFLYLSSVESTTCPLSTLFVCFFVLIIRNVKKKKLMKSVLQKHLTLGRGGRVILGGNRVWWYQRKCLLTKKLQVFVWS